jgi:hypothetical protein
MENTDQETTDYIRNMQAEINKRNDFDFGLSIEMKSYNTSMSKVQAHIEGAFKDSKNPFFKSSYADLESVWGVARQPLAENGFSVMQTPCKTGQHLITTISHTSGAWVRGSWPLNTVKKDPQGYMASVTYARRGSLASMLGIYQTDDDGNEASNVEIGTKSNKKIAHLKTVKTPQPKNKTEEEVVSDMAREVFDEGAETLSEGRTKQLNARLEKLTDTQRKEFFAEMVCTKVEQIRKDEYVKATKTLQKVVNQ